MECEPYVQWRPKVNSEARQGKTKARARLPKSEDADADQAILHKITKTLERPSKREITEKKPVTNERKNDKIKTTREEMKIGLVEDCRPQVPGDGCEKAPTGGRARTCGELRPWAHRQLRQEHGDGQEIPMEGRCGAVVIKFHCVKELDTKESEPGFTRQVR